MTDKKTVIKDDESHIIEDAIISDEINQVENALTNNGILTPEMIAEVKKQVTKEIIEEIKEDKVLKKKETEIRQEMEDIEYQAYVDRMLASSEPWVDFVGDVRDTEKGQRLRMEWNDAYIVWLKSIGITGADDDQIVQQYVTMLLKDMNESQANPNTSDYE